MYIKQMLIIVAIAFVGSEISAGLHLPVPATVLGLIILFLALATKIIKLEHVRDTADFIVDNLSIFFVVPTVGIMLYFELLGNQLIQIVVPLLASILLGMFAAGKTTELVIRIIEKKSKKPPVDDFREKGAKYE